MRYVIISKAIPGNRPHKMYEKTDPRSGKILHIKQKGSPKPKETKQKVQKDQKVQEAAQDYGQTKTSLAKQNIPVNIGDTVSIGGEPVKVVNVGEHGLTVQTGTGEKLKVYHGEYQHSGQKQAPEAPQGQKQGVPQEQKPGVAQKGTPQVATPQSDAHLSWDLANYIKTLESDKKFTDRLGAKVVFDKPVIKDLTRVYGDRPDGPTGIEMTARDEAGDRIGHFELHVAKEKREIYIANVSVENKHQKKGFGTSLIDKIVDFAKENGYPKLTLISNGEVGVYAWSMNGFDFDPADPDGQGELIHEFTNYLRKKYPDEEFDPAQFKHPWDIAVYKIGDEKVGKDWMIGPGHIYQFFAELNLTDPFSLSNTINNKYRELRGVSPSKTVQAPQVQPPMQAQQPQKPNQPKQQQMLVATGSAQPQAQMQKAVDSDEDQKEPNIDGKSHDMNSQFFHDELEPVEDELMEFIGQQSEQFEKQSALDEQRSQQQIQEQAQTEHKQGQIQEQLDKQKQEKQQQQIQEYNQAKKGNVQIQQK